MFYATAVNPFFEKNCLVWKFEEVMADPAKKLSFGFTKTTKRPNLSIKPRNDPKQGKQLIDCLEGKLIKVIGGDEKFEEKPLIIPLQPSSRRALVKSENGASSQSISSQNEQNSNLQKGVTIKQEPLDADEPSQPVQPNNISLVKIKTEPTESEPTTLEEIAAREILREAEETQKVEDYSNLAVPAIPSDDTLAAVSTEEDYENIPVSAFGKAMLKGMGWEAEKGVGKEPQVVATVEVTGPKRLAASSAEQKLRLSKVQTGNTATNSEQEELKLIKGAFVKILSGAMKGEYGEVEGFTDECDRVLVKMVIRGGTVSFSEASFEVVSKSDFSKNSRILNSAKYEEVKNKVSKSLDQPSKSSSESSSESSPERRDKSPVRRDQSPGPRDKSLGRRDKSPGRRDRSPGRRGKSPGRRDRSPGRRDRSHGRRDKSPVRRDRSPGRRDMSPVRRDRSPGRRDKSPVRRDRSPGRRDRSPDSRRGKRDRSSSSERRPKQFRKTSFSPSPDRNRKKTDSDRKYSRQDSPRKSTPPRRRRSLSSSPVRESSKKSSEESSKKSKLESRSSRRSFSRSVSPRKSDKSLGKSRRDRSSDSDSDSRKKVKKSKKKHKKRSSSASSSDSDSPKRSSHKKKKKSAKKKKSKNRDSSSSPERQKKSSKK